MKNLFMHFQIASSSKMFATLITWNLFSWTAVICLFNPIFCVKFLPHSSHLNFFESFMNIFHMHFKIELSNNFFFTNFTFEFCISQSANHLHDVINWFIWMNFGTHLFYFMNILYMYFQIISFGKFFYYNWIFSFFHEQL